MAESLPAALHLSVVQGHYKYPKTIGPAFSKKHLPWFETYYHKHGRYPTDSEVMTYFGWSLTQVKSLSVNKFWLGCLDRRGMVRPNYDISVLSDRQNTAIAIITNWSDTRSPVSRLADAGITEQELQGFYSNPHFMKELVARSEASFNHLAPAATAQLGRAIQKGNFQAVKFYYEITGRASSPEAVNVKRAMQVLIEAVQKHVKDPTTLAAIAAEVQALRSLEE
jgi:hypothetical protein